MAQTNKELLLQTHTVPEGYRTVHVDMSCVNFYCVYRNDPCRI